MLNTDMVMVPREPTPDMARAGWALLPSGPKDAWDAGLVKGKAVYRAMIAAAPVVPLTDEQLAKIAVEDEFLLYCDQDSFNEIARAIEQAHGIGGGGK